MVTLKEIALKSNFSKTVVSRALNPNPDSNTRISEKTREKIRQIAASMGYTPNKAASLIRRGKAPSIGLFVHLVPNRLIADFIFGVGLQAAELGYPINLAGSITYQGFRNFITKASMNKQCAMITFPIETYDPEIKPLIHDFMREGGSVIMVDCQDKMDEFITISVDDQNGAYLAAQRLLECNCQTFFSAGQYQHRHRAFKQSMKEVGRKTASFTNLDECSDSVLTTFKKRQTLPIGIFATSDEEAYYLIGKLQNSELKVGSDVMIIGYDDLFLSNIVKPGLTTIHQPFLEMGKEAVKMVVNLIEGRQQKSKRIRPKLIVRDTA